MDLDQAEQIVYLPHFLELIFRLQKLSLLYVVAKVQVYYLIH